MPVTGITEYTVNTDTGELITTKGKNKMKIEESNMNNETIDNIKQDINDIRDKVFKKINITPYNQGVLMGLEAALMFIDHHANEHKIRQLRKGNLDNEKWTRNKR